MDIPFKISDLLTFPGIALVIPFLIEGIKKIKKPLVDGREPLVAMVLAYVIGVGAKLTYGALAFQSADWFTTLVSLFFVGIGAMKVHDDVLAKILKWGGTAKDSGPTSGGQSGRAHGLTLLMACLLAVALCATAVGCKSYDRKTLAIGFEGATEEIFKEYTDYVIDGKPRPAFTEKDKETRRGSLNKVRELIQQGKE